MLFKILIFIFVVGLFVTPITYYLRSRRNPPPPTHASADSYREWKD